MFWAGANSPAYIELTMLVVNMNKYLRSGLSSPGFRFGLRSSRPGNIALLIVASLLLSAMNDSVAQEEMVTVIAGEDYAVPPGGSEFFLGENYRDLWTTPIEVEVLDMKTFAGGLAPVMRVGGFQSLGLALRGADGRDYTFRSVDKDYAQEIIPKAFRGTFVEDVIQDQVSAQFPAAQLVAEPMEKAVGILGLPEARMVVMPDDPALGEYRDDFAGVLGLIIEFPQPVSDSNPGYRGALEITGQEEFWALRQSGPENLPDSRAYLRARLFDLFLNDWDRHDGNWRWGRFPDELLLQPMPEDRDQIFASFEGASLDFARLQGAPFVKFDEEYEPFHRLLHNGWDVDRYVLSDIEKDDWMSIARDVQSLLTDEVIDEGMGRLPAEYYELRGEEITATLRLRRDALLEMAAEYYAHHADTVDIHATDADETVMLDATIADGMKISIAVSKSGQPGPAYYSRTFHAEETDEIRVFLHAGADTVVTRGPRANGINVRVIGGPGLNTVDDSNGFAVKFYSAEGENRIVGDSGTKLNAKPFVIPPKSSPNDMENVAPQDWGSLTKPVFVGAYHSDPGLLLGAGVDHTRYGFRHYPWASQQVLSAAWGFGAESGFVDYKGKFRLENSNHGFSIEAKYSGLDYLRYHGIGNNTQNDEDSDSLYEIDTTQFTLFPSFVIHSGDNDSFRIGPSLKYTDSSDTDPSTILGQDQPTGFGKFGQAGILARGVYDSRGAQKVLSPGWLLEAEGAHYFEAWDVDDSFSYIDARIGRWFKLSEPVLASLNVRAKHVWGDYPFFEAAYIGGDKYPLGTNWNRWAGDSSIGVLGSVRWTLMEMRGVFPGHLGIFAMANAARVFVDGEDSSKWHPSYAAGLVLTAFDHTGAIHLGAGSSEDDGFFVMLRGSFALKGLTN
jgi:hypothetical protein